MATHASRRRRILEEHPEVRHLAGPDRRSKYVCLALAVVHVGVAVHADRLSHAWTVVTAYAVGATLSQALFLAIHEMSHNLFFHRGSRNRALSIVANLPLIVPFAIPFRHYHLDHHSHLGERGRDADLPTDAEIRWASSGPTGRVLWACSQIVLYAVRPLCTYVAPIDAWTLCNVATQVAFDVALVWTTGLRPILYLVLSVVLAGGLHPCAGHFFFEHSHASRSQPTTSYYGPINRLTWNVGYHNEHHDFPNVPWSRLPTLNRVAREHYASLETCDSWCGAMVAFVRDGDLSDRHKMKT